MLHFGMVERTIRSASQVGQMNQPEMRTTKALIQGRQGSYLKITPLPDDSGGDWQYNMVEI